LASRYALAMDSRDLDALVELFVEDVRVGREASGREALRRDFARQLRELGTSILFVGNHVIDFQDADHASGSVYCKAEIQLGERWIRQAILYRDRYEKRRGHWYFLRRQHLLFYGADFDQKPLGLPPANWPENATGMGSLPEGFESWKRFLDDEGGA
jgi:hypothetical protein